MNEHNEYRDNLCDPLISGYLGALGCDIFSPECWIVPEEIEEQQLDHVVAEWTGQVPEGFKFHSYRYTNNFVQTWLRENYNYHIWIVPYVGKDDQSFQVHLEYNGIPDSIDIRFETYEEALESGIKSALVKILKEKLY